MCGYVYAYIMETTGMLRSGRRPEFELLTIISSVLLVEIHSCEPGTLLGSWFIYQTWH